MQVSRFLAQKGDDLHHSSSSFDSCMRAKQAVVYRCIGRELYHSIANAFRREREELAVTSFELSSGLGPWERKDIICKIVPADGS